MSIRKQFVIRGKGIDEELQGFSFEEVYRKYKGQDAQLIVQRYDSDIFGIGYVFTSESLVGDLKENITKDDYYTALDSII